MTKVKVVNEKPEAESLELIVTEKTIGSLETNIEMLEKFVDKRLEEYSPDKYEGDADSAKKARAELNKARDSIKRERIDLINELMKPYAEFEERCKKVEKKIDQASGKLDEIVKQKEAFEKERRMQKLELFWTTKNCDVITLDKIFNPKWLNKTYKESDILDEMDAAIDKVYKDLKIIERFSEDAETIKAHYLMNLDIEETMQYADELIRQKEIARKEAAEREQREHEEQLIRQNKETYKESSEIQKKQNISNLVDEAMGIAPKKVRKEYVISVKCFDEELLKLKNEMNRLEIEWSVQELEF